jgi:thiol-disulfide isomerase/thioredoxin
MNKVKYITVLSLIMLIFAQCNKNEERGYTIKGQVDGFKDSTILHLRDSKKEKVVDTTIVLNGEFTFKGQVDEPRTMMIMTKYEKGKRPKYISFWIENSTITVKGNADNFKYASISGSKPQQVSEKLEEKIKPYKKQKDSLVQIYIKMRRKGTHKENKKKFGKIKKEMRRMDSIRSQLTMEFIKANTNSYAAINQLNYKKYTLPEDTLKMLYQKLNSKYKNSSYGQILNNYLKLEKAEVGKEFLDFKAPKMNGDTFQLSDVKDKYIILDFWSPGCGPCRNANKFFSGKYHEMKDSIKIVSFALSKNKKSIEKAAKEDSITWTLTSTLKGMDGETALKYRVRGVPTFYLIAPSGKIIDRFVGFSEKQYDNIMSSIEQHKI